MKRNSGVESISTPADIGGGGGGRTYAFPSGLQGFDPLPTQRVPLCTILRYPFLVMDPKIFLKAPLEALYTNFEEGVRAEKTLFFGQHFPRIA